MSGDWVREHLESIDIDVDIINQFIELKINKRRFLRLNEIIPYEETRALPPEIVERERERERNQREK